MTFFDNGCPRCGATPCNCYVTYETYPTMAAPQENMGWICPRCQVVHAPHVASCHCSPKIYDNVVMC